MPEKLKKSLAILSFTAVFLFLVAFTAVSLFDSPGYAWRLMRYGQSDINDHLIFPARAIQNGEKVSVLEKAEGSLPQTFSWHS